MSFESSTAQEEKEAKNIKVHLQRQLTMAQQQRPMSMGLLQPEVTPSRRRSFAIGFAVQVVFVLALIRFAAYAPQLIQQAPRESVVLIAPRLETPAPMPKPVPQVVAPRLPQPLPKPTPEIQPPPVEAKVEMPKPIPTPVPVPVEHHIVTNNFAAPTPVPPKPETAKLQVMTNVFSGSSAQPTIKAPAQQVQTGGFGDPNGFRGQTDVTAKLNAPKLGGFDRPTGPGDGNGTAGAHGRTGVVASAGFGSGVATTGGGTHETPGGGVHSGGFGDARAASGEPVAARNNAPAAMVPVEIVEKPQPQYTKEARDLKIEGEVHLKVLFQADGSVHVLQVVHGLGHGLDEAATAAAQKIRFKPAQRDGRPCDMTATVHIVFQLAS